MFKLKQFYIPFLISAVINIGNMYAATAASASASTTTTALDDAPAVTKLSIASSSTVSKDEIGHTKSSAPAIVKAVGDDFIAVAMAPSGVQLYFHMVKVTKENYPFWATYYCNAPRIAGKYRGLFANMYKLCYDDPEKFTEEDKKYIKYCANVIGYTEEQFLALIQKVSLTRGCSSATKRDIADRFTQIGDACESAQCSLEESKANKQVFVAFASTKPLAEISQVVSKEHEQALRSYYITAEAFRAFDALFRDIVLSVNVLHNPRFFGSTHWGIFRNPLDLHRSLVAGSNPYRDIAMILHGFAATVEHFYFAGKVYMNSWLMKSMADIAQQTLGLDKIEKIDIDQSHCDNKTGEIVDFSSNTRDGLRCRIKLTDLMPLFEKVAKRM